MLKRCLFLLFLLLSACNDASNAASGLALINGDHKRPEQSAAEEPDHQPLQVTAAQKKAFRFAAQLLVSHHYRDQALEPIALDVHDDFIQALDPTHLYFLQSDIDDFRVYRHALLDSKNGDLSAPIEIYNRYRERAEALNRWSLERLEKPFDLQTSDTIYFPVRKEQKSRPWSTDLTQAQAQQEKHLQDQLIRLMIGGKSETEALKLLKNRYRSALLRLEQFSGEDLFDIYMNVIAHRFDPHTDYLSPRHSKDFNMNMSLQLEGIGAVLSNEEDKISIRELIPGGPAYKSGKLHLRDQIIGVAQGKDGEMVDVIGWRLDRAVDLIRGTKGTEVRLLIEPANGAKGVHEVTIVRDRIKLEDSAAQATVEMLTEGGVTRKIGVIKLPSFYIDFAGAQQNKKDYRSTTRDVSKLIRDLKTQHVDGIVIDLRNNGGGSLFEAVNMVGLFIDRGPVVMVSESDGSARTEEDNDAGALYTGPLAVLINHQSASASEIFAAAIQDYQRGLIIGSNSYGKGTVQTMMNLNDLSGGKSDLGNVKFTIAMFHRVTGGSTQLKGVVPDISLPEAYDLDDIGERAENYALPWKTIPAAKINKRQDVTPKIIQNLQKRHDNRMQTKPALQRFSQYVAKMAEKNQQRSWSLNLADRKAEYQDWRDYQEQYKAEQSSVPMLKADEKVKAKIDERNAAVEDEEDKEIFVPDITLYESLEIFFDYIGLHKK